jgi:hypothetical protein
MYVNNWITAHGGDGFIDSVGSLRFDGREWLRPLEDGADKQAQ